MKARRLARLFATAIPLFLAMTAHCEHFDIDLTVEGAEDRQEAHRDEYPPFEGHNRRPIFHGRKGEVLHLQFLFTNANPHDFLKQVGIRYYIVPDKDGSIKSSPNAETNVVVTGRFVLDFKFKGKLGFKEKFSIPNAGRYLLRVESSNSAADHEHFAAIDLDIQ